MTEEIIKKLKYLAKDAESYESSAMAEAASMIERLLANAKEDAVMLSAYHKWCKMNGCPPSSSDLITARAALAGEKKDE